MCTCQNSSGRENGASRSMIRCEWGWGRGRYVIGCHDVLASFTGVVLPAAEVGRGEMCLGMARLPGLPLCCWPWDEGVGICVVNAGHGEELIFFCDSLMSWVGFWLHGFP